MAVLLVAMLICLSRATALERGRKTCPGMINVGGYGAVSLINAKANAPGDPANTVRVLSGTVTPEMKSRSYFADRCEEGEYDNTWYTAMKLLGKTFRYTTDLSGVGCGCNAALYLVSMKQNNKASKCSDYYCDANSVCGEACVEVDVQEANQHAWHSTLHSSRDGGGASGGYGGYTAISWGRSEYAPGARCVDTSAPFQVAVSFPVDAWGVLKTMDVTLSQQGRSCNVSASIGHGYKGLEEVSAALSAGMTPVVSYWGSGDMLWIDGPGGNGRGPCQNDEPWSCPNMVRFYDFSVDRTSDSEPKTSQLHQAGQAKVCPGGWKTPPECVESFTYKGDLYVGCTLTDARQGWCSHDRSYKGSWSRCRECNPISEVEHVATDLRPATATLPPRRPSQHLGEVSDPAFRCDLGGDAAVTQTCIWSVRADGKSITPRTSFQVSENGNGVSLHTFHGKYLSVDDDGDVKNDCDILGAQERFLMRSHLDGSLSLQTTTWRFVGVSVDGALRAESWAVGDQERFWRVDNSDGTVALRTFQGTYLRAGKVCSSSCREQAATYLPSERLNGTVWEQDTSRCHSKCASSRGCAHFVFPRAGVGSHAARGSAQLRVFSGEASHATDKPSDTIGLLMKQYLGANLKLYVPSWSPSGLFTITGVVASCVMVFLAVFRRRQTRGGGAHAFQAAPLTFEFQIQDEETIE